MHAANRLTSLRIHTISASRRLLSAVASSCLFVMQIRIGTLNEIILPATQSVVIALRHLAPIIPSPPYYVQLTIQTFAEMLKETRNLG